MINFSYILIFILIIIGIFGYISIRDFLFLMNFLKEQQEIRIYAKKFKKYNEEKKKLLDKRLQREKELREEYGLDYVQQQSEEIIVGFAKPEGKHSMQEFMQNKDKYLRIMEAAKSGKSMYWKTMLGFANQIGNNKSQDQSQSKGRGRSR
jgi:hypothetical protein